MIAAFRSAPRTPHLKTAVWCLATPAFLSPLSVVALRLWTTFKLRSNPAWHGGWSLYIATGVFWWIALGSAALASITLLWLALSGASTPVLSAQHSPSSRQMKISATLAVAAAWASIWLGYFSLQKLL